MPNLRLQLPRPEIEVTMIQVGKATVFPLCVTNVAFHSFFFSFVVLKKASSNDL